MGWKAGIGYELGRGTNRNAASSNACIEIRLSVSFKSFIIYGNRLSLSFVLFFFHPKNRNLQNSFQVR